MNKIPLKLRNEMAADPYYLNCARARLLKDHACKPDPLTRRLIEWEHALMWAGKQLQEKFAIIPSCWWAHRGPGMKKEINKAIAYSRMTEEDLEKYPGFHQERKYLIKKYSLSTK